MRVALVLSWLLIAPQTWAYELIAHRGVHQTYHRKNLHNDTCTAVRIDRTGHDFIENTLRSMRQAFDLGATMVEFDIHPTTESDGTHKMVVFHDWTLNCRTEARCSNGCHCNSDGQCLTHEQPLDYLQSLDIGYGYTFDNGKTFPLRGHYVGAMPTLEEVLDLLVEYPDKKFLVNQKDDFQLTIDLFIQTAARYPSDVRQRLYFPYSKGNELKVQSLGIHEALYQGGDKVVSCLKAYFFSGMFGHFPKACSQLELLVPIRETLGRLHPWLEGVHAIDLLWGWPERFIDRAHHHQSKVYAAQVDSLEEYDSLKALPLDGIMTNKIELLAPAVLGHP